MNNVIDVGSENSVKPAEILLAADSVTHPGHILVPTDFSARSKKAVRYAIKLAQCFNARLTLLHVYVCPHSVDYLRGERCSEMIGDDKERARQRLTDIYSEALVEYPKCGICFVSGSLGEELARAIDDLGADLIVICARRHHWYTHLADESDVTKILRGSACPILVVPE
jgi:nucleotide-binding universal stress UspA family protein